MSFPAVNWRLILLLGTFALLRPLLRITGIAGEEGLLHPGVAAVGMTVLITAVWVFAVVQARTPRPVVTLLMAGLTYAVLSALLSGVLSPILNGQLQGPLTDPFALLAVLVSNAMWGTAAGLIARGIQSLKYSNHP